MPALFVILAQRLGIDATLSTAPEHLFVKYRDSTGAYLDLECTDHAGLKADASYIREMEITPKAVEKRVYLQPLTKKQCVVEMACTLGEHYMDIHDAASLHALGDWMLRFEPDRLSGIHMKVAAYNAAIEIRYRRKYRTQGDVPADELEGLNQLVQGRETWLKRRDALGWHWPSEAFQSAYQRSVKDGLEKQKQ